MSLLYPPACPVVLLGQEFQLGRISPEGLEAWPCSILDFRLEVWKPTLLSDSLNVTCLFPFLERRLKTVRVCGFPGMCVVADLLSSVAGALGGLCNLSMIFPSWEMFMPFK